MSKQIDIRKMTHDDWLAERRKGIGGSDAGAIVGLNPYVTPYMLWADKTGRLPAPELNEAMRQGKDLEEYVAARFTEKTGKKVRRRNVIFVHDDYDFIRANIDRDIVGEDAGLECKTTSVMNLKRFRNGEFPDQYYTQCVHYLAVTGYQKWYLAVLVLNQGFYTYEIDRDDEEVAALIQAEKDFWETYIVPDVAPPVDGYDPTSRAQGVIYPGGDQDVVSIYRQDVVNNYLDIKAQIKALEIEKEKCEQIIKEDLKDAEIGQCGPHKIVWRSQERSTFDAKRFALDHPKMDLDNYYKLSQYRVFKIEELKEAKGGK